MAGKSAWEGRRRVGCRNKLCRLEHLRFFVFKGASGCSEKAGRPNSHHWYPLCTRCWVSSGGRHSVGAQILRVKFVEPFTAPGTETISSGFCLILRTTLSDDIPVSQMSKLRLRKLAPHPAASRRRSRSIWLQSPHFFWTAVSPTLASDCIVN